MRRHASLVSRARSTRSLDYVVGSQIRFFSQQSSSHSDQGDDDLESTSTPPAQLSVEEESSVTVFPWRNEEILLPRLVPGTLENSTQGQLLSSTNTPLGNTTLNAVTTAYMFLDLPIWQLLMFPIWKADLADSMSWAFTRGVSNLLSKMTRVPMDTTTAATMDEDDYEINFQTTITTTDEEGKDENNTSSLGSLNVMMDEKLLSLYESSLLKDGTEICLQSKPYSSELVSLYCIPYISRSNIKNDPSLQEFYRKMLEKRAMDRSSDLAKLRTEYLETGKMESTVIAQILVWCNEKFYVKDNKSGTVLQGQEDEVGRNVPHLLRMEMTVKTEKAQNSGSFKNTLDNWIITDIDDLVQGNLVV